MPALLETLMVYEEVWVGEGCRLGAAEVEAGGVVVVVAGVETDGEVVVAVVVEIAAEVAGVGDGEL